MKNNFIGIIMLCCIICSCSKSSNTAPSSSVQTLQAAGTLQLPAPRVLPVAFYMGGNIYIAGDQGYSTAGNNFDVLNLQTSKWNSISSATSLGFAFASATANNTIGMFAGSLLADGSPDPRIVTFDNNNTPGTLSLPLARSVMGVTTLDNVTYFAGGATTANLGKGGVTRVDSYDQNSKTWSSSNALSVGRSMVKAIGINKKVLFIGGLDPNGQYSAAVDILDVPGHSWSASAMSAVRAGIAIAANGNKVFIAGGLVLSTQKITDVVDVYDTQSGTWSVLHLGAPRAAISAATIGNFVVFAGGQNLTGDFTDVVEYYNVVTNTWGTTKLSIARANAGTVVANNKLYIIGGNTAGGSSNAIDIFSVN